MTRETDPGNTSSREVALPKLDESAGVRLTLATSMAMIVAIICLSGASVLFKFCADQWDERWALAVALFVFGNLTSFLGVIATTVALKNNEPNIVYATIGGPGAAVLHLTLAAVFQQGLPWWQWLAIGIIVLGATLLHVDPKRLFGERSSA
jgi:multidrug transporter EmrE-like cation transporter